MEPKTKNGPKNQTKLLDKINNLHQQCLKRRSEYLDLFDTTSLTLWAICPRKYFFAKELGVIPAGPEPVPFTLGRAIHSFIENYSVSKDIRAATNLYMEDVRIEKSDVPPEKVAAGLHTMFKYVEEYEHDEFAPLVIDGRPMVEVGFAIDLTVGILWGRIDRIGHDDEDPDGYVVLDHKHTYQRISDRHKVRYLLSNQITNYMLAATELLGRRPTKGVVDLIRVTEENAREQFCRIYVYRTDGDLAARKEELQFQIATIKEAREFGISAFTMNAPDACVIWGRYCEYMPLCMAHVEDLVVLIERLYEEDRWKPFEINEQTTVD